jgi:hypothetical protein
MKHKLLHSNNKGIVCAALASAVFALAVFPRIGAAQVSSLIYPWWGPDELTYFTLPVGGWNVLGPSSVRGMAMGETLFGNTGPASGFFNPAVSCRSEKASFTLSYRYAHTVYRGNFPAPIIIPMLMPSNDGIASFARNTESLDRVGISLPFCGWSVAANYGLSQEFNIPGVKPEFYSYWSEVAQSGRLRGANLSVSRSLTRSFSLGVSISYLFGDLSRSQTVPWLYWILEGIAESGGSPPQGSELDRLMAETYSIERYNLDFNALAFNLGLTFRAGEAWTIGLLLRPPFTLDVDANLDVTYGDPAQPPARSADRYSLKQPFVAVSSVAYRPVPRFELTADLSYWGWGQSSAPYPQGWWSYSPVFKSVLKLNLGAEYRIGFSSGRLKELALRAGYVHDPQPYPYGESWARSYLTGGFGLSLGDFEIEAAAKVGVAASELNRLHSNIFQLGAGYRF